MFDSLDEWIANFRDAAGAEAVVIVVGNKIDLKGVDRVWLDEAKGWWAGRGLTFVATSAKTAPGSRAFSRRSSVCSTERRTRTCADRGSSSSLCSRATVADGVRKHRERTAARQ
jgi:hypothetical protein